MTATATPLATEEEREEEQRAQKELQDAQDALSKARKAGKTDLPPIQGYRGFAAPIEQNSRILVKPGKLVQIRDASSPTGMRDASRQGDKFAHFTNGVLVTDDPDIIKWCEEHPKTCRDVEDPMTSTWYMMRSAQIATKNREATLPSEVNVDAALAGDLSQLGGETKAVAAARIQTQQANAREA